MKRVSTTDLDHEPKRVRILIEPIDDPFEKRQFPQSDLKNVIRLFKDGIRWFESRGDYKTDIKVEADREGYHVTDSMVELAELAIKQDEAFDAMKKTPPSILDPSQFDVILCTAYQENPHLVGDAFNKELFRRIRDTYKNQQLQEMESVMDGLTKVCWGSHVADMLAMEELDSID